MHARLSAAAPYRPATVAGIDGCRGAWVVVRVAAPGDPGTVERVVDLAGVLLDLASSRLAAVGIDVPIGLPAAGRRRCDVEARAMIGARRGSVFPAPVRDVLGSADYEEAVRRSRAITGVGISRQVFGILPKIHEVDGVVTPELQRRLVEVHPEVSFTCLAGAPMTCHKAHPRGRVERLAALRHAFPDIDDHAVPSGTRPDDVLDAFVAAWSARRWVAGTHVRLGGALDDRGLRMEIVA